MDRGIGDPDQPADWAFISRYSPYQRLAAGVHYPTPFIYTSTEDDRVHPGHARKFAARLEALGDPFFYDEAIEGGHEAGVVPAEDARRVALEAVYLNRELPRSPATPATTRQRRTTAWWPVRTTNVGSVMRMEAAAAGWAAPPETGAGCAGPQGVPGSCPG